MRLLNTLTGKIVESTDEEWFDQEGFGVAMVNGVEVRWTITDPDDDPYRFGYISAEEAAKIPPVPEKVMKFYFTAERYGGDVDLIERAAKACNAQLVAVRGYALEDYPGNKSYVSGNATYIFSLERASREEAAEVIAVQLWLKLRELVLAREACAEPGPA